MISTFLDQQKYASPNHSTCWVWGQSEHPHCVRKANTRGSMAMRRHPGLRATRLWPSTTPAGTVTWNLQRVKGGRAQGRRAQPSIKLMNYQNEVSDGQDVECARTDITSYSITHTYLNRNTSSIYQWFNHGSAMLNQHVCRCQPARDLEKRKTCLPLGPVTSKASPAS